MATEIGMTQMYTHLLKWLLRSIASIIFFVCMGTAVQAASYPKINTKEARELLDVGLKAWCPKCDLKAIAVEELKNAYDNNFYYSHATWASPSGSPNLGNFAINPWTGDVWG